MTLPKHMEECPLGWDDCIYCINYNSCLSGFRPSKIEIAAAIAEKVTHEEAVESVKVIKGTWYERYLKMSSEEGLNYFYSGKRVQGLHHKDPIPQDGPSAPGGSSSKSGKKAKKGTKLPVYKWGSIL